MHNLIKKGKKENNGSMPPYLDNKFEYVANMQ